MDESVTLLKVKGSTHYVVGQERGSGSYGIVKEAKEVETGEHVALKQLDLIEMGISNLMEISIMSSIDHPSINGAKQIFCTSTHLNIAQHLAQCDLHEKVSDAHWRPDLKKVTQWMFSIAQGVKVLHKLEIIHGDIKTRNILCFKDASGSETVKLTDFSLSVKLWSPTDKFSQPTCTYVFCPPENLLNKPWDKSLDIWSLGCVFYQMVFGNLLFPNQLDSQGLPSNSNILRLRYYNAIAQYCNEKVYEDIDYIKAVRHPLYQQDEYLLIRDLIEKMIKFKPIERLTIEEVLNHPLFKGLTRSPCTLKKVDPQILSGYQLEKLVNTITIHLKPLVNILGTMDYTYVQSLAIKIYRRITPIIPRNIGEFSEFSAACVWMALKMVIGRPLPFEHYYSQNVLMRHEILICDFLHFCIPLGIDED